MQARAGWVRRGGGQRVIQVWVEERSRVVRVGNVHDRSAAEERCSPTTPRVDQRDQKIALLRMHPHLGRRRAAQHHAPVLIEVGKAVVVVVGVGDQATRSAGWTKLRFPDIGHTIEVGVLRHNERVIDVRHVHAYDGHAAAVQRRQRIPTDREVGRVRGSGTAEVCAHTGVSGRRQSSRRDRIRLGGGRIAARRRRRICVRTDEADARRHRYAATINRDCDSIIGRRQPVRLGQRQCDR